MKLEDCKEDMRVVYARGVVGPLIGKLGTVVKVFQGDNGIVRVKFDKNGNTYPCDVSHLDPIEE
jgi:ribosomal protein L35AE/L33A